LNKSNFWPASEQYLPDGVAVSFGKTKIQPPTGVIAHEVICADLFLSNLADTEIDQYRM
jgi:hypothetical protein